MAALNTFSEAIIVRCRLQLQVQKTEIYSRAELSTEQREREIVAHAGKDRTRQPGEVGELLGEGGVQR